MKRTTKAGESTPIQNLSSEQIHTLGVMLSRASLSARMGQQYGGDRDVYEALGYPDIINFEDYQARYERQDIARAVINRPAQFTWKGPLIVSEAGDAEGTTFEKAWLELNQRLQLKNKFIRLDKLSNIGNYGVLLLGFDDTKNLGEMAKPVTGKAKLNYVKPLAQGNAKINTYVKNTKDKRFGQAETYNVSFVNPSDPIADSSSHQTHEVHYSRILHVVPEPMESDIEGEPVMRSIWNRLMDLEKLVGGSAEMFWRGARPGYQGKIEEDYMLPPEEEARLQDQIDEFEHNLRRMLLNKGVSWEAMEPQVADPSRHVEVQIQMISAITGIPKRILTGSEKGELASEQDITAWYSLVQARREEFAEPSIIRPFVDKMIELGVLPPPDTGEYVVTWQDLFAASDKEQAEVGRIRATSLKEYAQSPLAAEFVPPQAFMKFMLGLDEDEIRKIVEMADNLLDSEQDAIRRALTSVRGPMDGQPSLNKKK